MGCLLCEWMWIFSVRLCRCRVLEETVTAGMVSLMLGGGFCDDDDVKMAAIGRNM